MVDIISGKVVMNRNENGNWNVIINIKLMCIKIIAKFIVNKVSIASQIKGILHEDVFHRDAHHQDDIHQSILNKGILRKSAVIFLSIFHLGFNLDISFCMQQFSANPVSTNFQYIQNSEAKKNNVKMGVDQVSSSQKYNGEEKKNFLNYFKFNFTSIANRILTIGSIVLCVVLSNNVISNGQNNIKNKSSITSLKNGVNKLHSSQSDIQINQDKIECLITTKKNLNICDTVSAMNRRAMSSVSIGELNSSELYNTELYDVSNSDSTSIVLNIFAFSLIIVFSVFAIKTIKNLCMKQI